jgi:hypothetical protein
MERNYICFIGVPFCQLEMQALLPQPPEACKAYLDSNVQEATQEGMLYYPANFLKNVICLFLL